VRQRYRRFEIIVVNDGSPDTDALEAALAPFRGAIRYFVQANRGAAAARNVGIEAARGEWIAFLDADDWWTDDLLVRQFEFLGRQPDIDLVYADARLSGESPLAGRRFMEQAPSHGKVTLESLIRQRCNVLLSTVVVRRGVLLAVGGFDETIRRGHDFDLWLRLALRGFRMAYQRLVLAERRMRADGLSGDSIAELERALHVLQRFGDRHDLPDRARAAVARRTACLADRLAIERAKSRLLDGDFVAARMHLDAAASWTFKVQLAALGLNLAPKLLRRLMCRAAGRGAGCRAAQTRDAASTSSR
jgi:glycosyltransferase involved in cell wall biosynthesis